MTTPGAENQPLRIAIVGAGPAAFYAAEHMMKQKDLHVEIDMFDRLPTPFGLVRGGVPPTIRASRTSCGCIARRLRGPGFAFSAMYVSART